MKLASELFHALWFPVLLLAVLIWIRVRMWKAARARRRMDARLAQICAPTFYAPTLTDEEVAEFHATRWDGD